MEDRTRQISEPAAPSTLTRQMTRALPDALADLDRTAMAGPVRALEVEAVPGAGAAYSAAVTREHLLLMVRGSGVAARRMPLNLSVVIDRSGSMEGEPLEYVKRACSYVVDLLEPTDVLSIVTFEEQVDVVMPARRVVNRTLLKEHIQRIQPGNTTNLYDGMVAGCMQVASVAAPGFLNRVLLLTDGEPTAGIKDFASIVQQVAEQKQRGITITALGFGSEYNEELMAGIARRSGGNYYFISQPSLIPEVFRREMETLMSTTAKNVRVRLSLPRAVQCRYVHGAASPVFGQRSVEFAMSDVERGAAMSCLSEWEFDPHTPGTYRFAKVDVVYDDAVTGRTEALSVDAQIDFIADSAAAAATKNPVVQRELEVYLASRNLEKTMMGMRTQQLTSMAALQEMQASRTILMNAGRGEQAADVTVAIDALKQGGEVEKTLIGAIYSIDQGKRKG